MTPNPKKPYTLFESATPLIESIHNGRLVEAVREARLLRKNGYRGAALFEFLALLQFNSRNETALAHQLVEGLRPEDLYFPAEFQPPESAALFRNAAWILQQEFPVSIRKSGFNPAERLELLCGLEKDYERARIRRKPEVFSQTLPGYVELGFELTELQTWLGRLLASLRDVRGAFPFIRDGLAADPDSPTARYAGHLLFSLVPPKMRLDSIAYSDGSARSFGAAPVPDRGIILKEYCGNSLRPSTFQHTGRPLSPVEFTDWQEGWMAALPGCEFDRNFADFVRRQSVDACVSPGKPGKTRRAA